MPSLTTHGRPSSGTKSLPVSEQCNLNLKQHIVSQLKCYLFVFLSFIRFMLAMGYSDVMPLSMLQHVQMNLDEYRGNGKKSKKSLGDEFEEKINPG